MNRHHKISTRAPLETVAFAAVGAVLGILDAFVHAYVGDSGLWLHLLGLVIVPCLAAEVALLSWRFRKAETYGRALLLCAIALVSWTIFDATAVHTISPSEPGLAWQTFEAT